MQSCGDQMFISFNKICAITHGRQVPQLLERFLAALIDLLLQTKPSTLPKVESIPTQVHHLDFFSDKAAEFIDFNQGTGLRVRLVAARRTGQASGKPFCDALQGFCQRL